MKKYIIIIFFIFNLIISNSYADEINNLYIVGETVYVKAYYNNVVVSKKLNKKSKFEKQDIILSAYLSNGNEINLKNKDDFEKVLNINDNNIKVIYKRSNRTREAIMSMEDFKNIKISRGVGYIGTITAIDKSGNFIGLGHNIKANRRAQAKYEKSNIYLLKDSKYKKSKIFKPGEIIVNPSEKLIGEVKSYEEYGVKGNLLNNVSNETYKKLGISNPKKGLAYIYYKEVGKNKLSKYEINIEEVGDYTCKIKIIDKELIENMGGIIQGMSGAPIIQNNKIVGALRSGYYINPKYGKITNIKYMI